MPWHAPAPQRRAARALLALAFLALLAAAKESGPAGAGGARRKGAEGGDEGGEAVKEHTRDLGRTQWRQHLHRLAQVSVDDRGIADLLGPVLRHKYELPPAQVGTLTAPWAAMQLRPGVLLLRAVRGSRLPPRNPGCYPPWRWSCVNNGTRAST
jgi:hypothetical protein